MDIPKMCLPDGHMQVNSIEEIVNCPWFWTSKHKRWVYRPEWVRLHVTEQAKLCEADEMWQ